ncbi:MFS transporter [Nocardia vermiculata]|uniref:MFS transporter n=1 Tax=Nocardia vermiculata TaxID=257274 RepID=A0A846Y723_9NOCA|nr:MFS transporter [Nocardia vermiculata]NKY53614.1 MFS transporter [Nocardia vermiculata]
MSPTRDEKQQIDDGKNAGSWRELREYAGAAIVLAGGVLVGAVNIYVAASLLPSAVADIGGERLYAWNMTAFLVAQVVATMLVGWLLSRRGAVGAYLAGFGVFAAGSVVCAASPTMVVLLAGRGLQGFGAGLLIGLGFAVIQAALPQRLWARGSALISAMYGVGNFAGPALGGFFAQFSSWRIAFVVLAIVAIGIAVIVPRVLPNTAAGATDPIPLRSLLVVLAAITTVAVAGILTNRVAMAVLIGAAVVLVVVFLAAERRAAIRVLPLPTYRPGSPLRWVYLTIACLAAGTSVEIFLPLFVQRMGGLPPVAAGFFGAALSLGWAGSQILSSSAQRQRTIRMLQVGGPVLLGAGLLVLALVQRQQAPTLLMVAGWLPLLLFAGAGIGIAMPHLSVAAMTSGTDADEGRKAAAAIATVLTMSTAFGAAIAGLLVNLGAPELIDSARWLLLGFAAIAAAGAITALRIAAAHRSAGHVAEEKTPAV